MCTRATQAAIRTLIARDFYSVTVTACVVTVSVLCLFFRFAEGINVLVVGISFEVSSLFLFDLVSSRMSLKLGFFFSMVIFFENGSCARCTLCQS